MIGKLALRLLRGAVHPSTTIMLAPANIDIQWDVPVRVRDGTVLRVNVFRSEDTRPVPHHVRPSLRQGQDPGQDLSGRSPNLQARLVPQPRRMTISALTSWEAPDPG